MKAPYSDTKNGPSYDEIICQSLIILWYLPSFLPVKLLLYSGVHMCASFSKKENF